MSSPANRLPAGVPAGGQFAPTAHAESDLVLAIQDREATEQAVHEQAEEEQHLADRRNIELRTELSRPDHTPVEVRQSAIVMVQMQLEDPGGLESVVPDTEENRALVQTALEDDHLVDLAVEELSNLPQNRSAYTGAHLAGTLYDLAAAEMEDQQRHRQGQEESVRPHLLASEIVADREPDDPDRLYFESRIQRRGDFVVSS